MMKIKDSIKEMQQVDEEMIAISQEDYEELKAEIVYWQSECAKSFERRKRLAEEYKKQDTMI